MTCYVAELIVEATVEGEADNVVHANMVLVEAESDEQAYERALELGAGSATEYDNPAGKLVRWRFVGLGFLEIVGPELEHGTEVSYEEQVGVDPERLAGWGRAKHELPLFAERKPKDGPDYSAGDIVREALALVRRFGGEGE